MKLHARQSNGLLILVGTTTVKAILISKDGVILGRSHEKVKCKMWWDITRTKN